MLERSKPITEADWQKEIEEQRSSGLSMSQWCKQHNFRIHQFYYWHEKLYKQLDRKEFIEVVDTKKEGLCIEKDGFCIHVTKQFDTDLLKQCLLVLREMK